MENTQETNLQEASNAKEIPLWIAIIPVIALISFLSIGIIVYGLDPHIPILAAAVVAALISYLVGEKWHDVENGMLGSILNAMQACIILMIVGMLIGIWIQAGIVPSLVYYGVQLISPRFFLITALFLTSIVALATGSSWSTVGTIGIALIGIAGALKIPLPVAAGAIISGAYFGDKLSPFSDTTNLAPAMAGTELFLHIKSMLYSSIPAYLISAIIFFFIGLSYNTGVATIGEILQLREGLLELFTITPWLLLPPLFVVVIVFFKIPVIPGLIINIILAGIFGAIFQGSSLSEILTVAHYGNEIESSIPAVSELLNRGGLDSMLWTISLIIIAMSFGGIMESSGFMRSIVLSLTKPIRGTGTLVTTTILTCVGVNATCADQYLSIVLPGRMYRDLYSKYNLDPRMLSRSLESGGTITSPFFIWNTCGATMAGFLGVSPIFYFIFCFFNLINPLIEIIYAFSGKFIIYANPEETKENSLKEAGQV